jgi:hypothetical protein
MGSLNVQLSAIEILYPEKHFLSDMFVKIQVGSQTLVFNNVINESTAIDF